MQRLKLADTFLLIIGCFLVLSMVGVKERYANTKQVRGVTSDTFKFAFIGDLTGPGVDVWKPVANGIRIYCRNINDQGGINGRKVKLIVEDDRFSIPMALAAFKKIVYRDETLAIAGASGQGQTYAIIPLVEKEMIPLLAVLAEPTYVIPARKYIYAVLPFYSDQVKIIFEYLQKDLKAKKPKIAFLYMDSASSKPIVPLVRKLAKKYVADLSEIIIPIAGIDMTSEVLRLKKANPDYIIVNGYVSNTASVLRAAKKFKFERPFIVTQYGAVKTTIELAKGASKNLWGVNCFGSYGDDSPGMIQLRKINEKYNPDTKFLDKNFMQGWFVAIAMHQGVKNAGRNLNGETLVRGLEKIKGFDTRGICGVLDFDSKDHKAIEYHRIYKADLQKKDLIPVTDWRKGKD
ncbi:MAG: ABC transporter substrate-binding protein [Spirochaetota bacterium]|nr:ABC transporter substrate-binding protein [Spirochaetota bacterium]